MAKLSKAQERVLRTMRGDKTTVIFLASFGGPGHCGWFSGNLDTQVRFSTIYCLQRDGYVKNIEDPAWQWRSGEYEITQEGLDILAALDKEQEHD